MRSAGLTLGAHGHWRKRARRSLIDLAHVLLARARAAAATGCRTFAVPEAAPVAVWIAARVADADLRAQAVVWLTGGGDYHEPSGCAHARLCHWTRRPSSLSSVRRWVTTRTHAVPLASRTRAPRRRPVYRSPTSFDLERSPSIPSGWSRNRPGLTAVCCLHRNTSFTIWITPLQGQGRPPAKRAHCPRRISRRIDDRCAYRPAPRDSSGRRQHGRGGVTRQRARPGLDRCLRASARCEGRRLHEPPSCCCSRWSTKRACLDSVDDRARFEGRHPRRQALAKARGRCLRR